MPGRLTSLELIDATEEIFRSGIPSVGFIGLSRDDAISWRDALELEGDKYDVIMSEPSKSNDPLGVNLLYSVIITNRRK